MKMKMAKVASRLPHLLLTMTTRVMRVTTLHLPHLAGHPLTAAARRRMNLTTRVIFLHLPHLAGQLYTAAARTRTRTTRTPPLCLLLQKRALLSGAIVLVLAAVRCRKAQTTRTPQTTAKLTMMKRGDPFPRPPLLPHPPPPACAASVPAATAQPLGAETTAVGPAVSRASGATVDGTVQPSSSTDVPPLSSFSFINIIRSTNAPL